jgi:hypothetical protein
MGYGNEIQTREQTVEEQQPEPQAPTYEGDMWQGHKSMEPSAQIHEALFGMNLPKTAEDFESWFNIFPYAIDLVARIPGFDSQMFGELNRDVEDLSDLARAEGFEKICASKMGKFIFKLRALVPKGDIPIQGMTGITAMITTNSNLKQEVRMPQQQVSSSIFDGVGKMLGRGK